MTTISNLSSRFKQLHDDLKISSAFRSNNLKNDPLLNLILFLLIIYGLYLQLQRSLSTPLTSDTVVPGLLCREILVHGNYFLKGFYFPFTGPNIFSDVLPFHLLPQLLTGYDPKALLLSAYSMYVATIIVYSVLVYNMTRKITNSLIFAALLANIPTNSSSFFLLPSDHVGTILLVGILLLIYRQNIHGKLSAVFLLVLAIVSFSDSLLILEYFIPFFVAHALLNKPFELRKMNFLFISGITVFLTHCVKILIKSPAFINFPVHLITSKELLFRNVILFFKGICLLYNNELYEFSNTHSLNIYTMIVIIITIGILYFVFSNISKRFSINSICLLFVFLSISLISIIYVFTSISVDISSARYFMLPLILSISILALTYSQNMKFQRVYLFLLLSLIIINAGSNMGILDRGHEDANREQYELIDYLKESNLTLGYGGYWDSNIITYLSKEKIIVRPVTFIDTKIAPFMWLSCGRWYAEQPKINDSVFIIGRHLENEATENFVQKNPPKKILEFKNYKIYVYDAPKLKQVMDFERWL